MIVNNTTVLDAQAMFHIIRKDYAQFLKFYREHTCLIQKLQMVEAQLQDVIAIPCNACGHTFNNCPQSWKKSGGKPDKEDSPNTMQPAIIKSLFEEVKAYLEAYNSSSDSMPVSATLSADNSIIFCKLFKSEKPPSPQESKILDSQVSRSEEHTSEL